MAGSAAVRPTGPLKGVERRCYVHLARLIQRRGRTLDGPAVRAAFSDIPILPCYHGGTAALVFPAWSWQLEELSLGWTRLIQRNRMCLDPAWFQRGFLATIVPADFVMARSHLRGLQRRVEAATGQPVAA